MKHLRKINNFNSYLALLSALDSAPIRRLEWQKHITEGLKEYCALIDSSSSFRAYRQALADTQPPCIPYIGLVLQDLTFVHIGNSDFLSEGVINFSKRWQQFNIVENMKRFKKGIAERVVQGIPEALLAGTGDIMSVPSLLRTRFRQKHSRSMLVTHSECVKSVLVEKFQISDDNEEMYI
ncbi:Rap guanine nucleotide exchange factor 1 [Homalodisca vitripennis]|nr:Rap guanine nucleotide exchange factor 1 [Homalodisca vitripennis]